MRQGAGLGGGGPVERRKVFYIPGYDPFPPRRYRELYRSEAARQAEVSGHEIALIAAPGRGWRVHALIEGHEVLAEVEVLSWSDLVQGSMGKGLIATYRQLVRTAWVYLRSGALFRLMRLRKGPMIAALYPVTVLVAELALVAALGVLVAWGLPVSGLPVSGAGGAVLRLVVFAGVVWAGLWVFRQSDGRLFAWYLMHDYAFVAEDGGAYPAVLEARLAEFRARLEQVANEDWDEVLVVGHSSGAYLAVSVIADLVRQARWADDAPVLSLLTLGQVIPMVSFLPRAGRLRADLRMLAAQPALAWVDVSAPGDGCAFALCDPVAVSGMAGPDKRWPLVLSAAFTRTLSPARWQALRRRWFRLHFQYLCAFDNLNGRHGEYDYFAVTAGPLTLAARFGARQPSKSRIETPLNPFGGRE